MVLYCLVYLFFFTFLQLNIYKCRVVFVKIPLNIIKINIYNRLYVCGYSCNENVKNVLLVPSSND